MNVIRLLYTNHGRKRNKPAKIVRTQEPPSKLDVPPLHLLQGSGKNSREDEKRVAPFIPEGADTVAYLGLSSDFDPHLMQYYNYDHESHVAQFFKCSAREMDNDRAFPVQFLAFRDSRGKAVRDEIAAQRQRLTILTEGCEDRLLRLFFRLVYPTYPIVDRKKFYADYMRGSENIDICLYAGILAISVIWNKYDEVLCVKNLPRELYDKLFDECSIAVERSLTRPTLGTVQGLLLLIQKHIIQSVMSALFSANLLMAKLISVAHTLGLHLDCSSWSISSSEKRLRKRIWATIYIVEKWASANLGHPSMLHHENSTWGVYDEDDPSSLLFVHFGRLTRILDGIMLDLYSVREYKDRYEDPKATISKVDKYFLALQGWRDELPEDLRDMSYATSPNELKTNGILHLGELTVAVLLQRIKMHPSCTRLLSQSDTLKYRAQASTLISRIVTYTSEIDNTHLKSFWHSMVRLNFSTLLSFMLMHHITSTSKKEFEETKVQIKRWTKMVQGLSKSWAGGTGVVSERASTVFLAGDYEASFGHPTPDLVKYGPRSEQECREALEAEEAERIKIEQKSTSPETFTNSPCVSPEISFYSISQMVQAQEDEDHSSHHSPAPPPVVQQPTTLIDPLQFDDELRFASDEPISFLTGSHHTPQVQNAVPFAGHLMTHNDHTQHVPTEEDMKRLQAHFAPQQRTDQHFKTHTNNPFPHDEILTDPHLDHDVDADEMTFIPGFDQFWSDHHPHPHS